MKKCLFFILFAVLSFAAPALCAANTPTSILDEAVKKFNSGGGVNIGFTLSAEGNTTSGNIRMLGKKFCCSVDGLTTWFDGKTMWTYVKQNEEVNVTTPSASEVAQMNPYMLLSLYKKGYKASMGKSTNVYHEIVLTGENSGAAFKKIVVRINKQSLRPMYAYMEKGKSSTTITVTSYKNEKLADSTFVFNKKKYPDVDIIDLR